MAERRPADDEGQPGALDRVSEVAASTGDDLGGERAVGEVGMRVGEPARQPCDIQPGNLGHRRPCLSLAPRSEVSGLRG